MNKSAGVTHVNTRHAPRPRSARGSHEANMSRRTRGNLGNLGFLERILAGARTLKDKHSGRCVRPSCFFPLSLAFPSFSFSSQDLARWGTTRTGPSVTKGGGRLRRLDVHQLRAPPALRPIGERWVHACPRGCLCTCVRMCVCVCQRARTRGSSGRADVLASELLSRPALANAWTPRFHAPAELRPDAFRASCIATYYRSLTYSFIRFAAANFRQTRGVPLCSPPPLCRRQDFPRSIFPEGERCLPLNCRKAADVRWTYSFRDSLHLDFVIAEDTVHLEIGVNERSRLRKMQGRMRATHPRRFATRVAVFGKAWNAHFMASLFLRTLD